MAISPSVAKPAWSYMVDQNGKVMSRYRAGTDLTGVVSETVSVIYSFEIVSVGEEAPENDGLAELVDRDMKGMDIRVVEELFTWAIAQGFSPSTLVVS